MYGLLMIQQFFSLASIDLPFLFFPFESIGLDTDTSTGADADVGRSSDTCGSTYTWAGGCTDTGGVDSTDHCAGGSTNPCACTGDSAKTIAVGSTSNGFASSRGS
jgi:hypothetical protein